MNKFIRTNKTISLLRFLSGMQKAQSEKEIQDLQVQLLQYITGGSYQLPVIQQPTQSYWNFTGMEHLFFSSFYILNL